MTTPPADNYNTTMLDNQESLRGLLIPSTIAPGVPARVGSGLFEYVGAKGCRQQLKYSLQLLALPVTAQIHLGDTGCLKVAFVAQAFESLHQEICAELVQQLTSEQAAVLARMEKILAWLRLGTDSWLWSDAALRKSAEWRQLRRLAREALVAFGWAMDLPPPDAMIYRLVDMLGE